MSAEMGSSAPPSWDLTRILLAVVAIGDLIAASFWRIDVAVGVACSIALEKVL
jgi:hypothetical protein